MASLLVGQLAAIAVQFLIGSVADDSLNAIIARGDGQILKVAHRVHVTVALLDCLFDLVLDKRVQVFDLSACQVAFLGTPFGALHEPDLPEPLLLCNTVRGLNVLFTRFSKVALGCVMVASAMVIAILLSSSAPMLFALLTRNASSVVLGLFFALLVTWPGLFLVIRFFVLLDCTSYPFLKPLLQLCFF
eukprot:6629470-Ditylum_brightwellii.AAC.1